MIRKISFSLFALIALVILSNVSWANSDFFARNSPAEWKNMIVEVGYNQQEASEIVNQIQTNQNLLADFNAVGNTFLQDFGVVPTQEENPNIRTLKDFCTRQFPDSTNSALLMQRMGQEAIAKAQK